MRFGKLSYGMELLPYRYRLPGNFRRAKTYDLFLAEVVACYADDRVATDGGDWRLESADPSLRTVHAASHGRFYAIGDLIDLNR